MRVAWGSEHEPHSLYFPLLRSADNKLTEKVGLVVTARLNDWGTIDFRNNAPTMNFVAPQQLTFWPVTRASESVQCLRTRRFPYLEHS